MQFYFLQKFMYWNTKWQNFILLYFILFLCLFLMFVLAVAIDKFSIIQRIKPLKPKSGSYQVEVQPLSEQSVAKC